MRTSSPTNSFIDSMQVRQPSSSYASVAQHDTGACETYACNMDEQSLNRDNNLEHRLEKFFDDQAPHYKARIPIIMDAYREWPLLLFGDLDHNYGTDFSRPIEKDAWNNEDIDRKRVRVQVAQDYIYCSMDQSAYMHPREVKKYTQAKLGTSKAKVAKKQNPTKGRKARKVVARASKIAGSIGSGASKLRRSVKRVSFKNNRLSAPTVVKVANRP